MVFSWLDNLSRGLIRVTQKSRTRKSRHQLTVPGLFGNIAIVTESLEDRQLLTAFIAGDIAVLQVDASASNTTASIVELNTTTANQTAVQTIVINGTSGSNSLRFSGSATSTGYLADSNDGSLLALTGANTIDTAANANTYLTRGVGTFDSAGNFAFQTTYTGNSGSQTRGATSTNNTSWTIGDQGGLYTNGLTAPSPTGNFRAAKAFGGTIYVFTASATSASVFTVSSGTVTALPGLPNGTTTAQDFYLVSSGANGSSYDELYILSASSATAGTIAKYSLVSSSWTSNGSYTTNFGGFGLAASKSGSGEVLYVSSGTGATTANKVMGLFDAAGYNQTINVTTANNLTLYTAPTGKIVKGVAFAPVSSNNAPVINSVTVTPSSPRTNDTLSVSVSSTDAENDPVTYTYQWQKNGVDIAGATSALLNLSLAGNGDKGDTIQVKVTPNDGKINGSVFTSSALTVLNSAPVISAQAFAVAENSPNGTSVGTVTSSDPDQGDSKTFAITAGNLLGAFAISSSGVITVADSTKLVFATNPTFVLTVSVTDGSNVSSSNTITVNLSQVAIVNHEPSGTDKPITAIEDTTYVLTVADFGFSDPNDATPNILLAVKITTLPAVSAGTLTNNGSAVSAGQFIAVADISSGLLRFVPGANGNGTGFASFTFQVQDNGGTANGGVDLDQSPNTLTFNVSSVNDAPSGANATVTTNEDTSYTFVASNFGFADASDNPVNSLQAVKISSLPLVGTLTNNGTNVAAGQFVSVADINAGLLKFAPATNKSGAAYATFTFQVQDDGGTTNGGIDTDPSAKTITINVTSVNDAPSGVSKTINVPKNTSYTFGTSDFGFSDSNDSPANTLSAVTITTVPALGFLTNNGILVTAAQSIAVADITGGLLQYTPPADIVQAGYATFTFQVRDNGGTANTGVDLDPTPRTITVNVTDPTTLGLGDIAFTGYQASTTDKLSFVLLKNVNAGTVLTFADGEFLSTGSLATNEGSSTLTFGAAFNAGTTFDYDASRTAGALWASGGSVANLSDVTSSNFGLNASGDNLFAYNGATAPTTSNSTAWVAAFASNAFLTTGTTVSTSLTYLPSAFTVGDNAFTLNLAAAAANENGVETLSSVTGTPAQIRATLYGSTWTTYTTVGTQVPPATTFTITSGVNHAPAGTDKTIGINGVTPYTFSAADFGFSDTNDTPANALLAVEITTVPTAGTLSLGGTAITAGTFVTAAQISTLTFTPGANASGAAYASFTFQVQDNGGTSNGGVDLDPTPNTITFSVVSVNHAPSGTDKSIFTVINTDYTFTTADFGFSDPNDAPANALLAVTITTLPTVGTLYLGRDLVQEGDSISANDISSALLIFSPDAGGLGVPYASFTFQVQDNGGTVAGGIDLDPTPNTITVYVTAQPVVNHAPSGTDKTVGTNEDTPYTFTTGDFGFSDPNDAPPNSPTNSLLAVKITTTPGSGIVYNNNVAVTAGQFVSATNISNGLLKFVPAANANGNASFTFQVQDNGGTLNGGVDLDQSPNTLTINVASVNDAPSGADGTVTTNEDVTYTFVAADFGFSDANDNPSPNALAAVKITTIPAVGTLSNNGATVTAGQLISVADINSGLLKFTPAANKNGAAYASFMFQLQDDGGTASGGVNLDQSPNKITINVTSVNDAPSGADATVYIPHDTSYTFSASDFGFSDSNDSPANTLQSVTITTTPATGSLSLNGTPVTAGQSISVSDLTAGLLTFTPASGVVPTSGTILSGYASFTFQVRDNGGTLNGGVDLDSTPNTISISVTDPTILGLGDIAFTGYQATTPDKISFVLLANVQAGTQLTFTDGAWSGSALATNEGTSVITFGANFLAGTQLNYDATRAAGNRWTVGISTTGLSDVTSSNFSLNASGDNLFAYYGTVAPTTGSSPLWVAAFATNAFQTSGAASTSLSFLPSAFTVGANAFSLNLATGAANENGAETGLTTVSGTPASIRSAVYNLANWSTFTTAGAQAIPPATSFLVNRPPTDIALSSISVAENQPSGSAVGTLSATDPDAGDSFTYSLVSGAGETDNASFMIAGNQLATTASFDYETKNSYSILVQVTDAGGLTFTKQFTIAVTNVNEAPTAIALSSTSIAENQPSGTVVGTLSATDPDASDSFTYTLVSGAGGADNASFTIAGNQLTTAASFDYETKNSYSILVQVTDAGGLTFTKQFTIAVTNVNEAPTAIALSSTSIAENQPSGTLVGTLSATDPDAGDSFTYALVSGAGGADNASFMITGNQLTTTASFDYETKNSYSILVQVTDAGGLTFTKQFTIAVTNVNEAPTAIALSSTSIAENQPSGTVVGTLSATDPDAGDSFTYALVSGAGGADNASFMITGNQLATTASFDYETKNSYSILVQVTDAGGLTFTKQFTIAVTNVNEAPTAIALSSTSVAENQPSGTLVGTLSAIDPDGGDSLTFALVSGAGGDDNASFTISGSQLKSNAVFNYAVKNNYSILVQVTDAGGLMFTKQFTIAITNVNAVPTLSAIEGTTLVYSGSGSVVVTSSISVDDLKTPNLVSANVSIAGGYQPASDSLTFTNTATISGAWNSSTGTLTLSGTDTLANYQTALRSIQFQNTGTNTAARTISFVVNDGFSNSNTVSRVVDSAPTIVSFVPTDANPGTGNTARFAITFSESVVGITAANFTLAKSGVTGGVISLSGSGATYNLTVSGLSGSGTIGVYLPGVSSIVDSSSLPVTTGAASGLLTLLQPGGPVSYKGSTLTIAGTAGNDVVTISVGASLLVVVNGVNFVFSPAQVSSIVELASTGNDSTTVASLNPGVAFTATTGNGNNSVVVSSTVTNAVTLIGGSGNNTLTGGSGNDTLVGGSGSNVLNGGGGTDTFVLSAHTAGSATKDTLTDSTSTNVLSLVRFANNVTFSLAAGSGVSQLADAVAGYSLDIASNVFKTVVLGSGSNNVTGNSTLGTTIVAGSGRTTLTGGAGNDTLIGGAGNSVIVGGGGSDILQGGAGNNTITGGSGNDTLIGGSGSNVLNGGGGTDTFLLSTHAGGTPTKDTLTNSTSTNVLSLTKVTNNLTFSLASGSGVAQLADSVAGYSLDIASGTFKTVVLGTGNNNVTGNSTLATTIVAGSGNNTLTGGIGNDTFVGSTGNTVMIGGGGTDILVGGSGNNTITGGSGNDTLVGGSGSNVISGGGGTDTFVLAAHSGGTPTKDTLTNTTSSNVLSLTKFSNGLTFSLAAGSGVAQLADSVAGYSLDIASDVFKTVVLGSGNNKVTGNAAFGTTLLGGSGNNTLTGGTGNDTLIGGTGNNVITGGGGTDILKGGSGNNTITGGSGNDTLIGGAGSNVLNGGGGTDTFILSSHAGGAATKDTLTNSTSTNILSLSTVTNGLTFSLAAGSGVAQLADSVAGYSLDIGNNVFKTLVLGSGNNNVTGNSTLGTTIVAGSGSNTLTGGTGNDTFVGGTGNTVMTGGGGDDVLVGGSGNNTITGGSGNDSLIGGTGSNVLNGGGGTDTFVLSAHTAGTPAKDTLTNSTSTNILSLTKFTNALTFSLAAGSGVAQLADPIAGYSLDIAGGVFKTVVLGSGDNIVTGNATLGTTIVGGSGNNVLIGGTGNDVLVGGSGNDILIGGGGVDTLSGVGGDDILIGGTLSFSNNTTGLLAIQSAWNSGDTYTNRVATLRSGVGPGNAFAINATTVTTTPNSVKDTLVGGLGNDWFWANAIDFKDNVAGEQVN